MYTALCCPNCSDTLHYAIRHPVVTIVVIAFLMVGSAGLDGFGMTVFAYNEVDFGTDAMAEEYYRAILIAHNETGFTRSEYAPSGLTIAEAKEIICINTDEEAMFWLAEERNNHTGRLYYYILLGRYQNMLYPADKSCLPDNRYHITEILEDPSIVKLDATIDGFSVYDLATVAYFHGTEVVDAFVRDWPEGTLPTTELDKVKALLQ